MHPRYCLVQVHVPIDDGTTVHLWCEHELNSYIQIYENISGVLSALTSGPPTSSGELGRVYQQKQYAMNFSDADLVVIVCGLEGYDEFNYRLPTEFYNTTCFIRNSKNESSK